MERIRMLTGDPIYTAIWSHKSCTGLGYSWKIALARSNTLGPKSQDSDFICSVLPPFICLLDHHDCPRPFPQQGGRLPCNLTSHENSSHIIYVPVRSCLMKFFRNGIKTVPCLSVHPCPLIHSWEQHWKLNSVSRKLILMASGVFRAFGSSLWKGMCVHVTCLFSPCFWQASFFVKCIVNYFYVGGCYFGLNMSTAG